MSEAIYEIREGEYRTHFYEIDDLEDFEGDNFITGEELEAADNKYGHTVYKTDKIKAELEAAIKSIPENKKSVALGKELNDAIYLGLGSRYMDSLEQKGIRVANGRVFNKPVEQKGIRVSDFNCLKEKAIHIMYERGVQLQIIKHSNKEQVVRMIKKLVTWKEIADELAEWKPDNVDVKWVRKLWLDPTLVAKK